MGQKPTGFLHYNPIFDVIITFFNYDIKILIMMLKACWLLAHLHCTCEQVNYTEGLRGQKHRNTPS